MKFAQDGAAYVYNARTSDVQLHKLSYFLHQLTVGWFENAWPAEANQGAAPNHALLNEGNCSACSA